MSDVLEHLENGKCTGGWTIQHINAVIVQCDGSEEYVNQKRIPWLRAGVPTIIAKRFEHDRRTGEYICPVCKDLFRSEHSLSVHLKERECSSGYPSVLHCPKCSDFKCDRISKLFRHVEKKTCPASKKEPLSMKKLVQAFEKDLSTTANQNKLNAIHCELKKDSSRPGKLLVVVRER